MLAWTQHELYSPSTQHNTDSYGHIATQQDSDW